MAEEVDVRDPAAAVWARADIAGALADPDAADPTLLDTVHRVEHDVPVAQGRSVRVTETFTPRCLLRTPRRAVLHLSGPVTVRSCWNIPVTGYDAGARDAGREFFSFTADYVGFGESTRPEDGSAVTPLSQVESLAGVLDHVGRIRDLTVGIDLVVESVGGGIATQLAADTARVRSVVLSTIMYSGMSEAAQSILLSPEYRAFLESFDDGYLVTDGGYYAQFTGSSPAAVGEWFAHTQPGRYPTGFFLCMFEGLPYFDPSVARAPALVLPGPGDFVPPAGDAEALARDYGKSGAELAFVETGGHTPRFEAPDTAASYWRHVYEFIEA
ncbi:MAG: alpha/beta fold hydrolase [Acidimicrobiia bacterium]